MVGLPIEVVSVLDDGEEGGGSEVGVVVLDMDVERNEPTILCLLFWLKQ